MDVYLIDGTYELFRAVARAALEAHMPPLRDGDPSLDYAPAKAVPRLLEHAADLLADGKLAGSARMVITEARAFPDLARIWYDDVAVGSSRIGC